MINWRMCASRRVKYLMKNSKIQGMVKFAKQHNVVLQILVIYSVIWSIIKVIVGLTYQEYYFCVSGASTMAIAVAKIIYLYNCKREEGQVYKCVVMCIFFILSSILFAFYMARLFFIDSGMEYGLILSITIATFSFSEIVVSIIEFVKANKAENNMLVCFKAGSMITAGFAISLTQIALLSATQSTNNYFNALTGVIFGIIGVCISIFVLLKTIISSKHAN